MHGQPYMGHVWLTTHRFFFCALFFCVRTDFIRVIRQKPTNNKRNQEQTDAGMLKNEKIKSCSFLKIKQLWSHLLKKCLMENFIFCACQRTTGFYGTVSNKGLKQIFLWCSSNGWNVKNYETNKGRQQQSKNILKLKIGKKIECRA